LDPKKAGKVRVGENARDSMQGRDFRLAQKPAAVVKTPSRCRFKERALMSLKGGKGLGIIPCNKATTKPHKSLIWQERLKRWLRARREGFSAAKEEGRERCTRSKKRGARSLKGRREGGTMSDRPKAFEDELKTLP